MPTSRRPSTVATQPEIKTAPAPKNKIHFIFIGPYASRYAAGVKQLLSVRRRSRKERTSSAPRPRRLAARSIAGARPNSTRDKPSRRAGKAIHEFLHRSFLFFDAFDQFELGAAAVQIMAGAMHAEISVAGKKVGQKAQADGEGDELAGEGQIRFLRGRQERAGRGDVTAGQRLEHPHFH